MVADRAEADWDDALAAAEKEVLAAAWEEALAAAAETDARLADSFSLRRASCRP